MRQVKSTYLGDLQNSLRDASCALCRLFAHLQPQSTGPFILLAYSSRYFDIQSHLESKYYKVDGLVESPVFAIVDKKSRQLANNNATLMHIRETGFIAAVSDHCASTTARYHRLIPPNQADFVLVKKWLQWCETNHQRCRKAKRRIKIQGLRLIDCCNRRIVAPDDAVEYLALSYVWGSPSSIISEVALGSLLPSELPQTIIDSIKVTQWLGFRYLWIDRYCIPQRDTEENYSQIRLMGAIYMNAEATIVAAAGSDPSVGLPGAGHRKRNLQQQAVVDGIIFCSTFLDAKFTISKSSWMSRAWTYQEGVLSRRLIIFTDDQIYFECQTMHCSESAPLNLEICHTKGKQELLKRFHPGMFTVEEPNKARLIEHVIVEYSKRTLTRDEDSLKAVLGILDLFERGSFPIWHVFGIPCLSKMTVDQGFHVVAQRTSQCHGFTNFLLWRHVRPSRRRPNFPSWSWSGWEGELDLTTFESWTWMFRINDDHFSATKKKCHQNDISVSFETRSYGFLTWDTVLEGLDSRSLMKNFTGILKIHAFTMAMKLTYFSLPVEISGGHTYPPGWYASFSSNDNKPIGWSFYKKYGCSCIEYCYVSLSTDIPSSSKSLLFTAMILNCKGSCGLLLDTTGPCAQRLGIWDLNAYSFRQNALFECLYHRKDHEDQVNSGVTFLHSDVLRKAMTKHTILLR
ncbi:heterokaryon incompatibility protein-domain-containing protein [Halenospora varia]|nr:heterokaryon incompatibility protein-domain-containing protein [Halenospora varia]